MKLFDNTEIAFALKSDSALERAYFLFRMIQNQPMVRIGTAVTNFALKAHLPVEGLIRSTVFDHFCGGVTEDNCLPVIEKMYEKGKVHSVLDYSVEGKESEEEFDNALEKTLKTIDFAEEKKSIPYAVFKPTGFGRFALYEKISEKRVLKPEEQEEWNRVVARFHVVCKAAKAKNVPVLIDAEESWIQNAADDLIEDLMEAYNTEKAIVFNTLQMYRHDRMAYLKALYQRAHQKGYHIGMKVVRGAYMEKERERAQEQGYTSPICKDKQATDDNYNEAIKFMMEHKNMALFAGTHNEESSYLLMDLAKDHKIAPNDMRLWFGQLYGMSDHISFNLANEGYNVTKYVPFGPVRDVMPYLIRRAEENTSVAGQTSRELNLLKTERKRRKL
ncbi:proline dehydrogenase family protein [Tenacibaculum maritimum]|uniref:proline dehydrogenase family protein n=1 Tax=Tenacibaculum maritimum TaxID=107401 RepID=UPI0012E6889E|nr:proline dehydrogenase family protein [Tenacibaculum maritimum]MCD9582601.1 proline dehydrogenase family protein [Tenacibaculum maritimum]MCD9635432.1 proline dehydrogenase family protein [Tenacibaculum maritimum]CAA0178649.1 Proline dehydrogenase family protein [Tenacibaculum maritimum]